MAPLIDGDDIRLFVIQSIYEKQTKSLRDPRGHLIKDEAGKSIKTTNDKFIKEGFVKVWFNKNDIRPFGEYIGSKGQVVKNRTLIYSPSTQTYYKVAHSIDEMEKALMHPRKNAIGYNKNN